MAVWEKTIEFVIGPAGRAELSRPWKTRAVTTCPLAITPNQGV